MVAGASFVIFGLIGGFAYLAYQKKRELLSYGLAGLAVSFFLEGIQALMGPDAEQGFGTFIDILRNISLGIGIAFLGYVGAIEGWKYWQVWRVRRREAEAAFQLKLQGKKENPARAVRPEPKTS